MAKHKLDMTGVEEGGFIVADAGRYLARIDKFDPETASTGTEMEVGYFEIQKGEFEGARIRENFPLTQKALFKVKQLLKALGIPHEGKIVFDTDKVVSKLVTIDVSQYEHEGKLRNRIDAFLPTTAAPATKADPKSTAKKTDSKSKKPVDDEDDEDEPEKVEYKDMTPKALYSLCKERDIEVKPKLEASVYIKKLKAWDADHVDDDSADDDDWADDDE